MGFSKQENYGWHRYKDGTYGTFDTSSAPVALGPDRMVSLAEQRGKPAYQQPQKPPRSSTLSFFRSLQFHFGEWLAETGMKISTNALYPDENDPDLLP